MSNRVIAKALGRSPTTVGNELRHGTPPRKSNRGWRSRLQCQAWRGSVALQPTLFSEAP
ncbi:helix-turn-helix domain-containing protein [Ruminococcus champanellensis]|uniref:helix-turn-helix domain-containing protein n=1 Tax=Ruminococcus champanellensis TaxID=1161942 RepID=UPI0039F4661A